MARFLLLFFVLFSSAGHASPFSAEAAVYRVHVPLSQNKGSQGTGVLIAADKILTNCHVLDGVAGPVRVVHRHSGREFHATRYRRLASFDACVLLGDFHGVPVRVVPQVQQGESVWVFGYPSSTFVAIQGAVKQIRVAGFESAMVVSAFCAGGSSGGPVVNISGQLVGLHWGSTVNSNNNECHAIPSAALLPYL